MGDKYDAFILDTGAKIYKWFGSQCGPFERHHCAIHAENLESQRSGHATTILYDDDVSGFWSYFPTSQGPGGANQATDDDDSIEEDNQDQWEQDRSSDDEPDI